MAKVRCPCGRQYAIADEHVGRRVKCRACGKSFVARPAEAAPAKQAAPSRAGRRPIGDRAVAQGLITRDELDACLEYQMACADVAGTDDRRLGQVLLAGGLLTAEQLQALLAAPRPAAAPEPPKPAPAPEPAGPAAAPEPPKPAAGPEPPERREHPVSEKHRDALRRTVEAATRKQAEKKKRSTKKIALPGPVARLRGAHVVLALALALGAIVVVRMWPAQEPARVLAAYLESCHVDALAPDNTLALRDLALDVYRFGDIDLGKPTAYDYANELKTFAGTKRGKTWYHLIALVAMPRDKRRALWLASRAFPDTLVPRTTTQLVVTVRPATVSLMLKPRGIGEFRKARCRFDLLKVETPSWQLGWRVGDYEQLAAGNGQ